MMSLIDAVYHTTCGIKLWLMLLNRHWLELQRKQILFKLFLYVAFDRNNRSQFFPNQCINIFAQYHLCTVLPCQKFHSKTWDRIYISNVSTLNKCSREWHFKHPYQYHHLTFMTLNDLAVSRWGVRPNLKNHDLWIPRIMLA